MFILWLHHRLLKQNYFTIMIKFINTFTCTFINVKNKLFSFFMLKRITFDCCFHISTSSLGLFSFITLILLVF